MIERLCEKCSKPVKGKLFKGMWRRCYDKSREALHFRIPKNLESLFREYVGERDDRVKCATELIEMGLNTWKHGQRVIVVPMKYT